MNGAEHKRERKPADLTVLEGRASGPFNEAMKHEYQRVPGKNYTRCPKCGSTRTVGAA